MDNHKKYSAGMVFNDLTMIDPYFAAGKCKCLCSCGEEAIVSRSSVVSDNTKSCGHRRRNHAIELAKHRTDYTYRKAYRNNSTGFKGVTKRPAGYVAYIRADGKQRYIVTCTTAAKAASARDEVERLISEGRCRDDAIRLVRGTWR